MSDDEDISEDVESLRDFCGVRTRDAFSREQFLDTLGRTLNEWADREENGYSKLIADVLPGIVRLSKRCPFSDVREKCSQILNDLKVKTTDASDIPLSAEEHLANVVYFSGHPFFTDQRAENSQSTSQRAFVFYPFERGEVL